MIFSLFPFPVINNLPSVWAAKLGIKFEQPSDYCNFPGDNLTISCRVGCVCLRLLRKSSLLIFLHFLKNAYMMSDIVFLPQSGNYLFNTA